MVARFLFVICLFSSVVYGYINKQPKFIKTCQFSDKNFINCSTNAVQLLFDTLAYGLPEIDLAPLDPLKIPIIKILQGAGPVNVNASLSNVTISGFSATKVLRNVVDPVTYDFYTDLRLPKLRIEGKYHLLGRILVIPLKGHGTCWFDAKNLDIKAKIDVKMMRKDQFFFYGVRGIHIKFNVGGLQFYMSNLFDGLKRLEESTNAYLNQNWRLVAESLNPVLSKTIEDIMFDILKKVFDNIPADFFISDIPKDAA